MNNSIRKLRWSLLLLFALLMTNGFAQILSQQEMKAMEYYDYVGVEGRFQYFCHRFNPASSPIYFCEIHRDRSGGLVYPFRINGMPHSACGETIWCYDFEWYRVKRKNDFVDLAVFPAKYSRGCDDFPGFVQPRPVVVYTLNEPSLRKYFVESFAELLLDPDFVSIGPIEYWYWAERSDNGHWNIIKTRTWLQRYLDETPPCPGNPIQLPTKADSSRLIALRRMLLEQFHSKIPETIKFVFDRNQSHEIVRAFIADSARKSSEGWLLWKSFQWTSQGWKSVPPEGIDCPSGKIPGTFHLSETGFFILLFKNEEPRLVTLRNTPKGPVEPFWENALSDKTIFEKTRHLGFPEKDNLPESWSTVPMPPESIAQSIYSLGKTRGLFRMPVVGLDTISPLWEPHP